MQAGPAKNITTGGYDYVVLQEQSTLPVKNARRMAENVRLFDKVIKQAGSKTVLYMTWARKYAPESQKAITDAYNAIGQEIEAIVVPVGVAWERFIRKYDSPSLYDRDESHPSLAGSYFAACVFLAALLKVNPGGTVVAGIRLGESDQMRLQVAAWKEADPRADK